MRGWPRSPQINRLHSIPVSIRRSFISHNLSQMILNDKDQHTGKPRMEKLAASAFQYARAYEGAAVKQTEKANPSLRISKEIDSMMAGLNPEAKEAVLGKERELYDTAMLMAAQGKQMSQDDVQMQRASNLVELGRQERYLLSLQRRQESI